MKMHTKIMM